MRLFVMVAVMFALAIPLAVGGESPRGRLIVAGTARKCSSASECIAGQACCGGSCANTGTDALNCGKCGKVCQFTDSCCAGVCTDLAYNVNHCGSCDNKCKKRCFYGMCDYA